MYIRHQQKVSTKCTENFNVISRFPSHFFLFDLVDIHTGRLPRYLFHSRPKHTPFIMDYNHLFAYLETRPIEETKNCMNKIVDLVRRHTSEGQDTEPFDTSIADSTMPKANEFQAEMAKLLNEKHVWVQQAVWNKFGSREVELTNIADMSIATAPLLTEPKVAQYILTVNRISGSAFGSKVSENGHFAKKGGAQMDADIGTVTRIALQKASVVSPQLSRR